MFSCRASSQSLSPSCSRRAGSRRPFPPGKERKQDQRKDSERAELEKQERALTTEIERLSYAIQTSKRQPDALIQRIDECDAKLETVKARLHLLGTAGDNIIPFKNKNNPNIRTEYEAEVQRRVVALRTRPKDIETRLAFRALVNTIELHPSRKRMPYEYTPYLNKAALLGMKLFPARRSAHEIVSAQGFTKYDIIGAAKSVSS